MLDFGRRPYYSAVNDRVPEEEQNAAGRGHGPDFELPSDQGDVVKLSSSRGRKVVLNFYPKDDTPGCTKEACGFRADYSLLTTKGAVVIGGGPDSVLSHARFRAKLGLPFHLLSDVNHAVAKAYGAWGQKRSHSKTYCGILRATFIVDERDAIAKVFRNVKPEGHAQVAQSIL